MPPPDQHAPLIYRRRAAGGRSGQGCYVVLSSICTDSDVSELCPRFWSLDSVRLRTIQQAAVQTNKSLLSERLPTLWLLVMMMGWDDNDVTPYLLKHLLWLWLSFCVCLNISVISVWTGECISWDRNIYHSEVQNKLAGSAIGPIIIVTTALSLCYFHFRPLFFIQSPSSVSTWWKGTAKLLEYS